MAAPCVAAQQDLSAVQLSPFLSSRPWGSASPDAVKAGFLMKQVIALFALCLSLMLLSGCQVQSAASGTSGHVVTMGPNNFDQTSIMIKQGQTITFVDDKATGSEHILVIGNEGIAKTEVGAPDFKGSKGITFQPGQSWTSPPWNTPGTYHMTCTIHPTTMNMSVTVTSPTTPAALLHWSVSDGPLRDFT